jgi:hypothetical protein
VRRRLGQKVGGIGGGEGQRVDHGVIAAGHVGGTAGGGQGRDTGRQQMRAARDGIDLPPRLPQGQRHRTPDLPAAAKDECPHDALA